MIEGAYNRAGGLITEEFYNRGGGGGGRGDGITDNRRRIYPRLACKSSSW